MLNKFIRVYSLIAMCLVVSCTSLRYLPANDKLYREGRLHIKMCDTSPYSKKIVNTVKKTLRPKPNYSFLGVYPGLWFYYLPGDTIKTPWGLWIRNTFGEPPVLLSSVKPDAMAKQIDTDLFNAGFFKSKTLYKVEEQKKSAQVSYDCTTFSPYVIKSITCSIQNDFVKKIVDSSQGDSYVKPNDIYNLDILKKERERIDAVLKDRGYFYFNPDYLLFNIAVDEVHNTVSLDMCIKEETPPYALQTYKIGTVFIDPDYSLQNDSGSLANDSMVVDNYVFVKKSVVRPKVILRCVFIKKDQLYCKTQHVISLNRLNTLGNYNFVDIKFSDNQSNGTGVLDVHIVLTPAQKRAIGAELFLVNKDNDAFGPKLSLNYNEKNTFGGAEYLSLRLDGSLETQLLGKYKNLYSYEVNPELAIFIPGFMFPLQWIPSTGFYIPKTKNMVGYSYLKRVNYFDMRTLRLSYGYTWKDGSKREHELNPVNAIFTSISNKSLLFKHLLDSIPFLKKSYEEQFIAGSFYSFSYNEQANQEKKNQFNVKATGELSGNVLWFTQKLASGKTPDAKNPDPIGGTNYSQFARTTLDARNYYTFPDKSKLVLRLYSGIGKAYGNSLTLPYSRQFFCGGPSSNRAFSINSVGPGSYLQNNRKSSAYLELGGDVKVEANVEYRWDIFSMLKGAVFVDAGNDWLLLPDSSIGAGAFAFNTFYKEFAIGYGVGLRADLSFFVFRLDLGIPLRKPWLEENKRWLTSVKDFGNYSWRQENMVLNIAIGYPF